MSEGGTITHLNFTSPFTYFWNIHPFENLRLVHHEGSKTFSKEKRCLKPAKAIKRLHLPTVQRVDMSSIPEADQTHIDLRLLDYVSEIDRNLLCPICHCPFIKPVRLPCDHSFCRQCLEKTFQAQTQDTKTCPTCRVPTEESNTASVPRFLIHLIDDLSVHCPNRSAGCTAQLRRGDVQSHVDHYCEYAETACPDKECKLRVRKTHGRTECPHTAMSCEKCDMQVMEDVMQVRYSCAYLSSYKVEML